MEKPNSDSTSNKLVQLIEFLIVAIFGLLMIFSISDDIGLHGTLLISLVAFAMTFGAMLLLGVLFVAVYVISRIMKYRI